MSRRQKRKHLSTNCAPIYAAPGRLDDLNARFRDHTVTLFKRHGIDQFGYWCPLDKQPGAGETLVYMLTHASPEAAKASTETAGGPLVVKGGVKSAFMKATDYSPSKGERQK